jgi:hypothetical protein
VRRRGVEDGTDRLPDAEIDDRAAVVGQDDVDEILADVVDVAAHRCQHDRAFFPGSAPEPQEPFMPADRQAPIEKIRALPAERIAEIEDFIDFICLRERERALTRAAAEVSAPAFAAIWNNWEDEAYDAL